MPAPIRKVAETYLENPSEVRIEAELGPRMGDQVVAAIPLALRVTGASPAPSTGTVSTPCCGRKAWP